MNDSLRALWSRYRTLNPQVAETPPVSFYFCDNQQDADLCAALVVAGKKRATAASLAELELSRQPVPQAGDLAMVTDWSGKAVAVIQTRSVEIRRLGDVDAEFAAAEGEGDGSLNWWRQAHLAYFSRVLEGTGHKVNDDLLIACEHFDCVLLA